MTARDARPERTVPAHPAVTGIIEMPYGYQRAQTVYYRACAAWAYMGWREYDPQAGSRWRGRFEGGTSLATVLERFRWRGRFMLEER